MTDPQLGEMVLRVLLRQNSDSVSHSLIVIGTVTTNTPLPSGDYSLTLHLTPKLMGSRYVRGEVLLPVPDGLIPPGMGADDILTSDIDLSPVNITRFNNTKQEQT